MKDELAEVLLTRILKWSDEEKAKERAILQDFARYKYDEYQQYAPGRRFIESLALWLRQFKQLDERRAAYDFVRNRLIFISHAEMRYLVELAFPTVIRPVLIEESAAAAKISALRPKAIVDSVEFRSRLRRTLILGLSDGARTDVFRRANPGDISNEQIWHAYDISSAKAEDMGVELSKDLSTLIGQDVSSEESRFQTVVLLDDFSASGTSFVRGDPVAGWKGKIPKILETLQGEGGLGQLIAESGVRVIVVIYVAATQAINHITQELDKLPFSKGSAELHVLHRLGEDAPLDDARDAAILEIARQERYFDDAADDEHGKVGGTTKQLGYAGCRLPVVLSHNTPNNSIFLLWGEETHDVRGLFPRVSRHRGFE